MPNAPPETTVTPRSTSSAARSAAIPLPYAVAAREPTMATECLHQVREVTRPAQPQPVRLAATPLDLPGMSEVGQTWRPLIIPRHDESGPDLGRQSLDRRQ